MLDVISSYILDSPDEDTLKLSKSDEESSNSDSCNTDTSSDDDDCGGGGCKYDDSDSLEGSSSNYLNNKTIAKLKKRFHHQSISLMLLHSYRE